MSGGGPLSGLRSLCVDGRGLPGGANKVKMGGGGEGNDWFLKSRQTEELMAHTVEPGDD